MDVGPLGAEKNFGVFKEPRGFIKVIQIIFAILAFATTSGFYTTLKISVNCPKEVKEVTFPISYFFDLSTYSSVQSPICEETKNGTVSLYGSYKASSQFFVFIGVIVFLYCLAAVVLYVFFDELYRRNHTVPKADFLVTLGFAVAWLFASSIWASGVSHIKYEVGRYMYGKSGVYECRIYECSIISDATYAGLNVSLICGFANSALWAASLWFLYKETAWHEDPNKYGGSGVGGPNDDIVDTGRI